MESAPISQRISVVVLTWNRADGLATTLDRLLALPENPPIFVADNGSDDNTVALVKARFPTVCVVECGKNLGAAGRNLAANCVATDYIAFCDDDTYWEPGSLERAVKMLDAWPNVGVLSARVAADADADVDDDLPHAAMRSSPLGDAGLPGPALTRYMPGACVFRTDLFRRVGGYEPHLFIGGEEELVALDVLTEGKAIVYCEQLSAYHHPSARRGSGSRHRMLARNAAWISWMRMPWSDAARATLQALVVFAREGRLWRDGFGLLRGWSWIRSRRQVVSSQVLSLRRRMALAERQPHLPNSATALALAKAAIKAEAKRQPAGEVDVHP